MRYRIGIDVGGTNTDAVLLDEIDTIVAKTKLPTTKDVVGGIENALQALFEQSKVARSAVRQAMLGTTQCTNAIVERKALNRVAHLRLAAPATLAVPPLTTIPADLREVLGSHAYVVRGGLDYDGSPLAELDVPGIRRILKEVKGKVEAISICGVFSPVSGAQEELVAQMAREELGDAMPISQSHLLGAVGLLERENASILNAALFKTARGAAEAFAQALNRHGVNAQMYFGQNDGTLMTMEHAISHPILMIASGPTNSIRGASYLANLPNALVVDVGGTTTDVGVLSGGFPRESSLAVEIGGVRTNFRMPDIGSIGVGGGTVVREDGRGGFTIGPDSVGYRLTSEALVFGGDTLTLTDIAVAKGLADFGQRERVAHLPASLVDAVFSRYVGMVESLIDKMKTSSADVPVILVGGGAILLPEKMNCASKIVRPENFGVANAIGVAIAQISGETEIVASLNHRSLNNCIDDAVNMAIQRAIAAGATPNTVKIVDVESLPLAYMPGNAVRIRAKAAGELSHALG